MRVPIASFELNLPARHDFRGREHPPQGVGQQGAADPAAVQRVVERLPREQHRWYLSRSAPSEPVRIGDDCVKM